MHPKLTRDGNGRMAEGLAQKAVPANRGTIGLLKQELAREPMGVLLARLGGLKPDSKL
jgi:hypothetical protein